MVKVIDVEINRNTTPLLLLNNGVEILLENNYMKVFGNPEVKEDISLSASFNEFLWILTNLLLRLNLLHGDYDNLELFYIRNWIELNK